jgi:uncharacterized protein (TIGR02246 family)
MLTLLALVMTAFVLPACQPAGEPEAPEGEVTEMSEAESAEAGIQTMIGEFEAAWNTADAAAIAGHFTADADFSGPDGEILTGSGAIETHYGELLATIYQGTTIEIEMTSIRWLGEDIALANGWWETSGITLPEGAEPPTGKGLYTEILVKDGDAWRIASLRAWYPVKAPGTT